MRTEEMVMIDHGGSYSHWSICGWVESQPEIMIRTSFVISYIYSLGDFTVIRMYYV